MSAIRQQKGQVKEGLFQFIVKHIPSANLNLIDDIVLSYVISILEEASQDPCFDVEGFIEMMAAYVPQFKYIDAGLVCTWVLELEAELNPRDDTDSISNPDDSASSDRLSLTLQNLSEMLPPMTKNNRSHSNSESSESVEGNRRPLLEEDVHAEQCQALAEMFPNTCAMEIKHCVSIAHGDVERAAATLLHRREQGQSLSAAALHTAARQPLCDDSELKNRIIARYSYVDKNSDQKEHKPLAPKIEPKKMVRYRDNKIVSLKEVYPFSEDYRGGGGGGSARNGTLRWGARFGPAHRPPAAGLLDCFRACRSRLDQYLARRKIERGVRLYGQNEQRLAVKVWLSALRGVRHRSDKFALLGHLYQAYMDFGKYRESLEFANRQLGISEELDSAPMRAEAYLNLARAHQTLGGLDRALSYARQALYNDCGGGSTAGCVHLTVAAVSLELGAFSKAMDAFQKALAVAQAQNDNTLLLQVYVGLSELWRRLRDAERAVACAARACDLGRGPRSVDLNTRHHRTALLQMAAALRARGELGDAHDYCNEALRLAAVAGDQGCYARAVRIAGDVYRRKCDIGKALRHYEVAMGAGQALGDRLAQMEAMDGAARCLEALRLQGRICNCRPLEFNTRLLEVATSVGSKMLVRRVRLRLAEIYTGLGDNEAAARQKRAAAAWLAPACARCREPLADRPSPLASLPCAHIVHHACMPESWSRRSTRSQTGVDCAECASPRAPRAPPPAPPAPRALPTQDFPFGTPPTLRESDLNSIISDHSSQQATSSV